MATLTGKLISNTYKDLLQVSNNNDGVDSTVRFVSDGEGTNSALKISNSEVETTGKLTVGAALSASGKITGDSATVITAVCASTYFGDGSNLTGVVASIPTSVTSFTANQLTVVSGAAFTGKVSGTAAEFSGIVSAGTFAGAAGIFTGKVSGTTLAMTGAVSASTFSGVGATFSGNVTAASYFGDGSNLTGVEASAATSVAAFTANQLTVVSGASFTGKVSGTAAEFSGNVSAANLFASTNVFIGGSAVPSASALAAVSALTSVNAAAITSVNTRVANTSSALATSIGNSNTNIAAVSALTSVNLAAVASVNTRVANTSSALATSIGNSNTNIAAVSVLTSVNLAAITSINSAALLKASNLSDLNSASTARTNLGVAIGSDVQAFDADILKADTPDELTAGFSAAAYDCGTKSSGTFTPDVDDGNFQYATNGGAHTLAVPSKNCTLVILYKNNASAGTITTSGYTVTDGDTITTTNGHEFFFYITRINDGSTTFSLLTVKALQ
mgnify:CR=1 FL=1|tara:strand:- start:3199 stop:4707 length:1509 start_codon:yes stop_codon:yes gene_type:complete